MNFLKSHYDRFLYWKETSLFDLIHDSDTKGVPSAHSWHVRWMLKRFAELENPAKFKFIDFGAGLGKPLLLAKPFGFHHRIGIEVDEKTCKKLRKNTIRSGAYIIRADASETEYLLSENVYRGNILAYFYGPFDDTGNTADIVERNLHDVPDSVYVIWMGLISHPVFFRPWWKPVAVLNHRRGDAILLRRV